MSLAGSRYPAGIPIIPEFRLEELCRAESVDQVVFAYSDVLHEHVMHLASRALAVVADFLLLGPRHTMLMASRPAIAVSGLRTGCGTSPISRWLARCLRNRGRQVVAIRHPMPYGNLAMEKLQRFASLATRCCSLHHRGTRGIRTAHHMRQYCLHRCGLRSHPRAQLR